MRTLLILLLLAGPAVAQSPSWAGKTILTKKPGIKIGHADDKGNQIFEDLDGIDYRVLAEDNGMIKVKTRRGQPAWFSKDDAVLLDDAVAHFTERISQNPNDATLYNYRAWAWRLLGKLDMALQDYNQALRLDAQSYLLNNRGTVYQAKKDYDKAIADFDEAIRLEPKKVYAYYNRGNCWMAKKESGNAIADFDEALRLDPKYILAYTARSKAWYAKKEYKKAVADYEEALRLDPQNAQTLNSMAWLLATTSDAKVRDGKKAVALAKEALESDKKNPHYMDTLAAAYAEMGDFEQAVQWQESALKDAQVRDNAEYRRRLELYRKKQAYHQE